MPASSELPFGWTLRHTEPSQGHAATSKLFHVRGMTIDWLEAGLIAESSTSKGLYDQLGLGPV